jgi:hypothetical protein
MKYFTIIFLAALVSTATAQSGGQYELSWSTIDGGGGVSSGGLYTLMATIAQPDAGEMSGGGYQLFGGFCPGGPLCIVEFEDFARLAINWLDTGAALPGDLYPDGIVDELDLRLFVLEWLYECPYRWPLR